MVSSTKKQTNRTTAKSSTSEEVQEVPLIVETYFPHFTEKNTMSTIKLLTGMAAIGAIAMLFLPSPSQASFIPTSVFSPCRKYNNCTMLRERLNTFQGQFGTKPALEYCRAKYGSEATVEWKFFMRWCATPEQF
jgi:hypothetical protein